MFTFVFYPSTRFPWFTFVVTKVCSKDIGGYRGFRWSVQPRVSREDRLKVSGPGGCENRYDERRSCVPVSFSVLVPLGPETRSEGVLMVGTPKSVLCRRGPGSEEKKYYLIDLIR